MVVQAKFAYDHSKNRTTSKSPFEVVYRKQPMHLYDLTPLPEIRRNSFKSENMANLIFLMNKKQYIKRKKAHQGHAPKYTGSIQEREKRTP